MGGYAGKFLQVDLKSRFIEYFNVPQDLLNRFIGGSGLGAALFLDRFDWRVDPLSHENPLMIMTGPLTGTNFPGSSRSDFRNARLASASANHCGGSGGSVR